MLHGSHTVLVAQTGVHHLPFAAEFLSDVVTWHLLHLVSLKFLVKVLDFTGTHQVNLQDSLLTRFLVHHLHGAIVLTFLIHDGVGVEIAVERVSADHIVLLFTWRTSLGFRSRRRLVQGQDDLVPIEDGHLTERSILIADGVGA